MVDPTLAQNEDLNDLAHAATAIPESTRNTDMAAPKAQHYVRLVRDIY
jgi:hypothetical protein